MAYLGRAGRFCWVMLSRGNLSKLGLANNQGFLAKPLLCRTISSLNLNTNKIKFFVKCRDNNI